MAKVHIVVSRTNARADTGSTLPIPDAVPVQTATITSAAASAVVATVPAGGAALAWHVTASGGPVWLAFGPVDGAEPIAQEGSGWLLMDGETRSLGASPLGQRLAIVDALL